MVANYEEDIHSFLILVKCIHKMILNLSPLQSKAHFTLDLFDKDEYFQFMRLLFKHSEKVTFKGFYEKGEIQFDKPTLSGKKMHISPQS